MKKNIKLCFSGWVNSFELEQVVDNETGNWIDIPEGTTSEQLLENLDEGVWSISFQDAIKNGDYETEMFDFDMVE